MKRFILAAVAILAASGSPAAAATITFTAPAVVSGPFDVLVRAQNLFAGRDPATDILISYGFNVGVTPGVLSFLGATSGPLFDKATTEPGTNVLGRRSARMAWASSRARPSRSSWRRCISP